MPSKEAQKGGRQELGWNGTGSTNPREGSPRKNWHKGSQTWTTKNGMLMIKGGRKRRKVSCRNQMSMTKERMMGTAGDFRTNTWWRNLGPRAKKRRRTKKEGGQEPFRLHYHQEGIRPILRKETSHERSTSEPQSFKLYLITVFVFYFQKLVFGNIKKKKISCIFEIKNMFGLLKLKK